MMLNRSEFTAPLKVAAMFSIYGTVPYCKYGIQTLCLPIFVILKAGFIIGILELSFPVEECRPFIDLNIGKAMVPSFYPLCNEYITIWYNGTVSLYRDAKDA